MSHSVFMPSWAALLRERYLKRSRQQAPPKRTQSYYYEIHRKPATKPKDKLSHDLATCPFARSHQKNDVQMVEVTSVPSEPIVKAISVHLLPIYGANQAGGIVYKPVAQLPEGATNVPNVEDWSRMPPDTDTKLPDPNERPNFTTHQPDPNLDHELRSHVSEYGFYREEHDLPTYCAHTSQHQRTIPSYGYYATVESAFRHPPMSSSYYRAATIPLSPASHPQHHQCHEYPDLTERDRAHHLEQHNGHHAGCPCDRCERNKINQHGQNRGSTHRQPPIPRLFSRHRQHEIPRSPSLTPHETHCQPRFSMRADRRPSHVRNRTSVPGRREI